MEQRLYKVKSAAKTHLVLANNQAQALRHVAGKEYTVEVAKAVEVAQMVASGVAVEAASAEATL